MDDNTGMRELFEAIKANGQNVVDADKRIGRVEDDLGKIHQKMELLANRLEQVMKKVDDNSQSVVCASLESFDLDGFRRSSHLDVDARQMFDEKPKSQTGIILSTSLSPVPNEFHGINPREWIYQANLYFKNSVEEWNIFEKVKYASYFMFGPAETWFIETFTTEPNENWECFCEKILDRFANPFGKKKEVAASVKAFEMIDEVLLSGKERVSPTSVMLEPLERQKSGAISIDVDQSRHTKGRNVADDEAIKSKITSFDVIISGHWAHSESATPVFQMKEKHLRGYLLVDSVRVWNPGIMTIEKDKLCISEDVFGACLTNQNGNAVATGSTPLKSSLHNPVSDKADCAIKWADKQMDIVQNLCEYLELREKKEAALPSSPMEKEIGEEESHRFVSIEACAMILSQAAEAVASGKSDVPDALSEAGLIMDRLDVSALELLCRMKLEGVNFTEATFVTAIKLCVNLRKFGVSRQIHCQAVEDGFDYFDKVKTGFMVAHMEESEMDDVFKWFSVIDQVQNVVSWTARRGRYLKHSKTELNMFFQKGERFYNPCIPGALKLLGRQGLIVESEGAHAVFIERIKKTNNFEYWYDHNAREDEQSCKHVFQHRNGLSPQTQQISFLETCDNKLQVLWDILTMELFRMFAIIPLESEFMDKLQVIWEILIVYSRSHPIDVLYQYPFKNFQNFQWLFCCVHLQRKGKKSEADGFASFLEGHGIMPSTAGCNDALHYWNVWSRWFWDIDQDHSQFGRSTHLLVHHSTSKKLVVACQGSCVMIQSTHELANASGLRYVSIGSDSHVSSRNSKSVSEFQVSHFVYEERRLSIRVSPFDNLQHSDVNTRLPLGSSFFIRLRDPWCASKLENMKEMKLGPKGILPHKQDKQGWYDERRSRALLLSNRIWDPGRQISTVQDLRTSLFQGEGIVVSRFSCVL